MSKETEIKNKKVKASSSEKNKKEKNKSTNSETEELKGVEQVIARNESLYSIYRKVLTLVIIIFIATGINVWSLFFFSAQKTPPAYIPVNSDNRLIELVPLNKPNVSSGAASQLALKAIQAVNTYDYINWKTQLQGASVYFTPRGWADYLNLFTATKTMDTVLAQRAIVSVEPTGNPTVVQNQVGSNGVYFWQIKIPIKVSYKSHVDSLSGVMEQRGIVTMYIVRVPTTQAPDGIAVEIYQFDTTKS